MDMYEELTSLPNALVIGEGLDVKLWRYRTSGESMYVPNLCALPNELLALWRNRFIVHIDAICWVRTIPAPSAYYVKL